MEIIRGPSISRPPVLDDKNYSYGKAHMISFLKTLDGRTCRVVVAGWDPPMITIDGHCVPKSEVDWTDVEEQASVRNSTAINTIFNGVDLNVFKLINSCSSVKKAWKILEVAYEGTKKVEISRLQLITSKFEALKMFEDQSVAECNERVLEIADESFNLGEKISESKIVGKLLRSLPDDHFGDDAKGRIIAKGNIEKYNLPYLNDVRYVEGLKENLISADNCYHWISNNSNVCPSIKEDHTWPWQRKLGHVSLRRIHKAVKNKAVIGIPNIDSKSKFFCGDYQVGKKIKASHKNDDDELAPKVTMVPEVAVVDALIADTTVNCFGDDSKSTQKEMDVKSTFLNENLNEEVYVAQPKGFIDHVNPQQVYKLNKALYGLKQALRAWYERLTVYLGHKGYSRGGLQIKQIKKDMFTTQEKYAKNLVKKFGLDQSQQKWTPTATHVKITRDITKESVDHKLYRSMIGSLHYLTTSRPGIAYAVGIFARFQSDPRVSHLAVVKRIIKYVQATSEFEVLYSYDTNFILVGYCDADWTGCLDDRKSTSGGCFFLGNNIISCFSKK
ncbi:gag-pol polyprotein [Cucumis melo var. makuwa]|uniref:Gag-pol polyprotein n=1 Tax=Cucumis melo var. makuwa TaxID=1194695 RepID=A0A5D3DEK1_CUCMM|nr:gag-pol polyprotein [Cucumis melo var. makuwa]